MKIHIHKMRPVDWPSIRLIYEKGLATRNATFETTVPDWEQWNKRHLKTCRFVAQNQDKIIGWAALSPVSQRVVYRGVAEVSLYVDDDYRGRGIGRLLLEKLIDASENAGIWTLQAMIFPENKASIHIHKKCGFREVGYRKKLGKLDNIWRDVTLMERRSLKDEFQ